MNSGCSHALLGAAIAEHLPDRQGGARVHGGLGRHMAAGKRRNASHNAQHVLLAAKSQDTLNAPLNTPELQRTLNAQTRGKSA